METSAAAASERVLETSERMSDPVIHAFHKLDIQIAVEALEGPGQTFILLPSIRVYEPGSGL